MKKIIILYLLVLSVNYAKSQEMIVNNSFETPKVSNDFPNIAYGGSSKLKNWHSEELENPLLNPGCSIAVLFAQSPDWWYGGQAHSGKGMVGMGTYEIIQQQLSNGVYFNENLCKLTNIHFYIRFTSDYQNPSYDPMSIKIYASKKVIKYESSDLSDECDVKWISHKDQNGQDIQEIASYPIDMNDFPISSDIFNPTWYEISLNPIIKLDDSYEWIGIELRKDDYSPFQSPCNTNCFSDYYMYLDDFSMNISELTDNHCFQDGMPPDSSIYVSNNYIWANGTTNQPTSGPCHWDEDLTSVYPFPSGMYCNNIPLSFVIHHTNEYDFKVFDRWGEMIYSEQQHCDRGFNNYIVDWNGESFNYSTLELNQGVYTWTLKLKNCYGEEKNYACDVTLIYAHNCPFNNCPNGWVNCHHHDNSIIPLIEPYDCDFDPNCRSCPYCLTESGGSGYAPDIYSAGYCDDFTNFNFVPGNGSLHDVHAGTEITFNPGTDIPYGTNLYAHIESCDANVSRVEDDTATQNIISKSETGIESLFPSPTEKNLNVIPDFNKELIRIEIINLYGSIVLSEKNFTAKSPINLNLSELSKGIFFVRLTYSDNSIANLKFIKI